LHWYRANLAKKGDKIGKINVPTLMISGINDMAVGQVAVDNTQLYMNAPYTLEKIEAGHWLIQESFDEVSRVIVNHIKGFKN
jgi:surfactin synthase thioesterase subunit